MPTEKDIEIISYTPDWQEKWDDFVRDHSRNGTIFHEQRFLSYHGNRFEDCSALALNRRNRLILAVFPAALVRDRNRLGVVSHPGSTYGGIVFGDNIKTAGLRCIVDEIIKYYYFKFKPDFLRITLQEEFHTKRSFGELTFLLWHRGFSLDSKEAGTAFDLETFPVSASFSKRTKEYLRSKKYLESGMTQHVAKTDEEIARAFLLIKKNLITRHKKDPTHSLEELLLLKRLYGERIQVFYSLHDDKAIGTVVVFELNRDVVHDFYIAQDYNYSNMKPLIHLFMFILSFYAEKGYRFYNFGISSRGKWIKWGILNFKEQLGGKVLTRDTWVLDDLSSEWPYDDEIA